MSDATQKAENVKWNISHMISEPSIPRCPNIHFVTKVMKSTWLPFRLPTRRVRRKVCEGESFILSTLISDPLSMPNVANMASRRILTVEKLVVASSNVSQ